MDEIANKVCGALPEGWEVTLTMENGAAWVDLFDDEGHIVDLPERDDRSLEWLLNEALIIANGWVPNA